MSAAPLALTDEDVAVLEAVLPGGKASGDRCAPEMARFIDR